MKKFTAVITVIEDYIEEDSVSIPVTKTYPIIGDVIRAASSFNFGPNGSQTVSYSNRFSCIADMKLINDMGKIENEILPAYITYEGVRFKMRDIDYTNPPRLIFGLGDVYRGDYE